MTVRLISLRAGKSQVVGIAEAHTEGLGPYIFQRKVKMDVNTTPPICVKDERGDTSSVRL